MTASADTVANDSIELDSSKQSSCVFQLTNEFLVSIL